MPSEFKPVALFGGAMNVELPSSFDDVSKIRQVPDNQEVYLSSTGFTSVSIDLLERVEDALIGSDLDALRYHLSDLVGDDNHAYHSSPDIRVWNSGDAHLALFPTGTPACTLLATAPPSDKQKDRPNEPEFVGILLTLVRLEKVGTDVVVAVNVPHVKGKYEPKEVEPGKGKYGELLEEGMRIRERVLLSLEVKDWGLFVQDKAE